MFSVGSTSNSTATSSALTDRTLAEQFDAFKLDLLALQRRVGSQEQELSALKQSSPDPVAHVEAPPTLPPRGPRNLVVCIDGTSNQFSTKNTNVVELYHRLVKDDTQLTFYNSGIGTYATPSWKSPKYYKQVILNKIDLAIAWNFEGILLSAYRWLAENYEDGDTIFLFGFSRGAYQIRTLSAMIHSVGLLRKGNQDQIPFAYELYAETKKFSKGRSNEEKRGGPEVRRESKVDFVASPVTEAGPSASRESKFGHMKEMCRHFKDTFSRRDVKVHFVGAWDTVSSVGLIRDKTLPGTTDGMLHVTFFRHALALHERRVKFLQENVRGGKGPTLGESRPGKQGEPPHTKEVWFAGSHGEIGGGAKDNLSMNQFGPALRWMLFEAAVAGLRLTNAPQQWEDRAPDINDTLSGVWKLFEYMPITRLTYKDESGVTSRLHRGRPRKIQHGQLIHATALHVYKKQEFEWRARLPPGVSWEQLREHNMIEVDPYAEAKGVIEGIRSRQENLPPQVLKDHEIMSLRLLLQTEPGMRSLRDAPYAEDSLMKALNAYLADTSDRDARHTVASAALATLNFDTVHSKFHYTSRKIRPLVVIARREGRLDVAERLEVLFAPGQLTQPLVHAWDVDFVTYLPDGDIVTRCSDHSIHIWALKSWEPTARSISQGVGEAECIGLSADGTQIATSLDNTIRIWSVQAQTLMASVASAHDSENPTRSIAFSFDGRRVAWDKFGDTVCVLDMITSQHLLSDTEERHSKFVRSVAFSPDGQIVISGSSDSSIRAWEPSTGRLLWSKNMPAGISSVTYSPDGNRIVAGCDTGEVIVLLPDREMGAVIQQKLSGHIHWVTSVAFSPDSDKIVSGSADHTVRLWSVRTGQLIDVFRGHKDAISSVAFSPDGKYIASASQDRTVRIWDATGGWRSW